jgi:hypothetical protein
MASLRRQIRDECGTHFRHSQPVEKQKTNQRMVTRASRLRSVKKTTSLREVQTERWGVVTDSGTTDMRRRIAVDVSLLEGVAEQSRHHRKTTSNRRRSQTFRFE